MSSFELNKEHFRHILPFLFNQMKNASESRRIRCAKFCFHGMKEIIFCIGSLLGRKNEYMYFANQKRRKSLVDLEQPSTSITRPNRFGMKIMLCIQRDQKGVFYYELLKPGEIVNTVRHS